MEIMEVVDRPMMENSFPTADGTFSSIVKPSVEANNFKIKPSIIQIIRSSVQFSDFPDEDPNKYFINFLKICDTFRFNGVSNDAVRLRIFPFSLCDTAKDWLQSLPAAAGGTIMKKLPSEAFNIIDEIATNLYSYGQERADKRTAGIHSIDVVLALSAQMNALTQTVNNLGPAMWNGPISTHTPTLIIRNGVVTQIFYGVTISSRDPLDIINLDMYNLHKRRKATLKICSPNSSPQQTLDSKIKMHASKVKKRHCEI
ncbi:UNVERIFIED_CONTAM: hypothetical protein Slati_3862000 [Sesamum latifolium]|uniref:Retrotransposon gag domain-containing protein n=1 Tax=Sesamum latifolium TaxID=2727402 RepID=A0AAW2TPE7_9LAMI